MNRLESENLRLRAWNREDAPMLFQYASNVELASLAGWMPHHSVSQSKLVIENTFTNDHTWAIELLGENRLIGCICLYMGEESNIGLLSNEVEVGIWIAPEYAKRGYGSEALKTLIQWCQTNTQFRAIYADCRSKSDPSYAMLLGCGFSSTGRINANSRIKPYNGEPVSVMKRNLREWILFLCHGNICRSTMAEFIMKDILRKKSLFQKYHIESAAVSSEEIGNPIYPPAARCLELHGVAYDAQRVARRVTKTDYMLYDSIICMDRSNLMLLRRIIENDPDGKVHLMMQFSGENRDVADPWYTGDFEATYRDVSRACLNMIENK
ncbi:MAG: GNAT family N-acetyltransferase [Alistipes sp.]|nr:GNAT family N-acetyltransferase [Candidatus Alistipes equi]